MLVIGTIALVKYQVLRGIFTLATVVLVSVGWNLCSYCEVHYRRIVLVKNCPAVSGSVQKPLWFVKNLLEQFSLLSSFLISSIPFCLFPLSLFHWLHLFLPVFPKIQCKLSTIPSELQVDLVNLAFACTLMNRLKVYKLNVEHTGFFLLG